MDIHMDIHIWVPKDPLGGIPWGGIPWGDRWDLGTDGTLGPMRPGPQGPPIIKLHISSDVEVVVQDVEVVVRGRV